MSTYNVLLRQSYFLSPCGLPVSWRFIDLCMPEVKSLHACCRDRPAPSRDIMQG